MRVQTTRRTASSDRGRPAGADSRRARREPKEYRGAAEKPPRAPFLGSGILVESHSTAFNDPAGSIGRVPAREGTRVRAPSGAEGPHRKRKKKGVLIGHREHAATVAIKDLLEAGVHFGHQTRRWNPKMRRYIFGERGGIHIIDLQQTE